MRQVVGELADTIGVCQRQLDALAEQHARARQAHAPTDTFEQGYAQLALQRSDLLPHGRVGDVQPFRGSQKCAYRSHLGKVPQLAKFHRTCPRRAV